MIERSKNYNILNTIIITFLVIQAASVSFSIAVSSIAFGIWGGLWIIQYLIFRKELYLLNVPEELKWITIAFIAYAIAELISRIFAVYPDGALIGLKRLLLVLIFFCTAIKIPDRKVLYFILFIVLLSVSIVSSYELIKYFILAPDVIPERGFSETRIDYLAYPLTSGQIKMMVLFSMFPLIFIKERFFVRKRYLILIMLPILATTILTQSRNVFLASGLCLILFGFRKNWKVLLISLAASALLFFLIPSEFTSRISSIFDPNHHSNAARLTLWSTGWNMFLSSPIWGVGDNMIMEVYALFKPHLSEWEHSHLHSNIFMILATTGLLGFLSVTAFFVFIFLKQLEYFNSFKTESDCALLEGSILVLISFLIAGIFEWSFGDHEVMTVFYFLIAVPFIVKKLQPKPKKP